MKPAARTGASARKQWPDDGESESDFMDRCMADMMGSGEAADEADANDQCQLIWDDSASGMMMDAARGKITRAYSIMHIKSVVEDARVIHGVATTPQADRMGDIIEPLGITYKNPMPLLWQHRTDQPIGHAYFQRPTEAGIEFEAHLPSIAAPGPLRDRINDAWESIKAKLVTGVSIGFRAIEHTVMPGGGFRFLKSEVLELSVVTVPANESASIQLIKSLDAGVAAPGRSSCVVRLEPPGASGKSIKLLRPEEGNEMKTIAEQITALETKRAANMARMEAVMQKSMDDGRSTDQAEQEEFDTLEQEVDAIDKDLKRLRALERAKAMAAKPVVGYPAQDGSGVPVRSSVTVKAPSRPEPGIGLAQFVRCKALAHKSQMSVDRVAESLYGVDSLVYNVITKAVAAGATVSGNWAEKLVGTESNIFADFAEYLRPRTIIGRFGTNGIPSLRQVPFNVALVSQTGAGAGYWVGEGLPKYLTAFDFERTTLTPLKVANICVLTDEMIRYSNPKADVIVRDELARALQQRMDTDFINPAKTADAGVSPASITNGATAITATGTTDLADIILDVRSVCNVFDSADNPLESGVWIMSSKMARALASTYTDLGVLQFPSMDVSGGTFFGFPVLVTSLATDNVILVNATDIYEADEGGIAVDISTETALEMLSTGSSQSALSGTGASLVSMFQTNSVAFRAERVINWARRRTTSVAYLTGVAWGGELNSA